MVIGDDVVPLTAGSAAADLGQQAQRAGSYSRRSASASSSSRPRPVARRGQQHVGARFADRVAEVLPQAPGLLGDRRRRRPIDARARTSSASPSARRSSPAGRDRDRVGGQVQRSIALAPAQRHRRGGGVGERHPHRVRRVDGPLRPRRSRGLEVVGARAPGRARRGRARPPACRPAPSPAATASLKIEIASLRWPRKRLDLAELDAARTASGRTRAESRSPGPDGSR